VPIRQRFDRLLIAAVFLQLGVGLAILASASWLIATERYGQVDLFCSNAGVIARRDEDAANAEWQRHWDVNVMAHVYAARAVLPQMLARGAGYLLHTVSAAGLLSQVNAAPYSVTKHAALGFAEWLSIAHGAQGIRVSALCPQGVVTPNMVAAISGLSPASAGGSALTMPAMAAAAIGATRFVCPVPWLGSTKTGRWLNFLTTGIAEMSSVLRV